MILGIDTSNYTTSVAVASEDAVVSDQRKMLAVKPGMRGLRQSEAFYQHTNNLPQLLSSCFERPIDGVCVSSVPRRVEGSYMPCFKAGVAFARVISDFKHIPLMMTSHQEGHIAAALFGNKGIDPNRFLSIHLSGGTTEILLCKKDSEGYASNIIGKTIDISAGQLLDRIGVACGLAFPCGREINDAYHDASSVRLTVSVNGSDVSFAGTETQCLKLLKQGTERDEIFSAVVDCISETIVRAVRFAAERYHVKDIVFAGGVSAGSRFRDGFRALEENQRKVYFAKDGLSKDNAVGVALLGSRLLRRV